MKAIIRCSLFCVILFFICGIIYPAVTTGVSQLVFPRQANGSMINANGKVIGSELIGQSFADERYFQGRVSAVNYNIYSADTKITLDMAKSGSDNLAPSNPKLKERIEKDIDEFLKKNPTVQKTKIPLSLFNQSFSGLDPDITIVAAEIQISRIADKTGIDKAKLEQIIKNNTKGRLLGIFGEESVNVLNMNLEIQKLIK